MVRSAPGACKVVKYRGSGFGSNEYPYLIEPGGIVLFPISKIGLMHAPLGDKVSSGHEQVDELMAGGYRRASAVLISGSSGTGKTIMACTFVRVACRRGEKVLYINYEESQGAMVGGMLSPGINLRPALRSGMLQVLTALPESMGAEEHLHRILKVLDEFRPEHVIVDSVSSSLRMGSPQAAYELLMRLVNICKERGITTVLAGLSQLTPENHDFS